MHAEANLEVEKKKIVYQLQYLLERNALLIGKNGKKYISFELLIRQMVNSNLKEPLSIVIDVGNYKEKELET